MQRSLAGLRPLILWLVVASTTRAQDTRPVVTRLPWFGEGAVTVERLDIPGPVVAYVARIDLDTPRLVLRAFASSRPTAKEPLSSMSKSAHALVALNASYFDMTARPCTVLGWCVIDGTLLAPPTESVLREGRSVAISRAAIWCVGEAFPSFAWVTRMGGRDVALPSPLPGTIAPDSRAVTTPPDAIANVRCAFGAGPMLIRAGRVRDTRAEERMFEGLDVRHPRSAVGLTREHRLLMVAVDGRSATSRGMTIAEVANLLANLGAEDALNFDGGGSTTLTVEGRVVNTPSGLGVERPVPTALGVFRRSP